MICFSLLLVLCVAVAEAQSVGGGIVFTQPDSLRCGETYTFSYSFEDSVTVRNGDVIKVEMATYLGCVCRSFFCFVG